MLEYLFRKTMSLASSKFEPVGGIALGASKQMVSVSFILLVAIAGSFFWKIAKQKGSSWGLGPQDPKSSASNHYFPGKVAGNYFVLSIHLSAQFLPSLMERYRCQRPAAQPSLRTQYSAFSSDLLLSGPHPLCAHHVVQRRGPQAVSVRL